MDINATVDRGVHVLRPAGRLDPAATRDLERAIAGALETVTGLLLDFADVTYIASGGLRVVLAAAKKMRAAGGAIAVCGLAPAVRRVFELAGFDSVIDIQDDTESALALLAFHR